MKHYGNFLFGQVGRLVWFLTSCLPSYIVFVFVVKKEFVPRPGKLFAFCFVTMTQGVSQMIQFWYRRHFCDITFVNIDVQCISNKPTILVTVSLLAEGRYCCFLCIIVIFVKILSNMMQLSTFLFI